MQLTTFYPSIASMYSNLPKVFEYKNNSVILARDLHSFLCSRQEFSNWIKNRIKQYELIEGYDFIVSDNFIKNPKGGRPLKEYYLTIEAAKEMAMVEGNEKGKMARKYFIECERKLQEIKKTTVSNLELLELAVASLKEQNKRIESIESKVNSITSRIEKMNTHITSNGPYLTILGYALSKGFGITQYQASQLGKKATILCKKNNYPIEKVYDIRFGFVGAYPINILENLFSYAKTIS